MFKNSSALFLILTAFMTISAQADADREAIKRTALNYAEGWYEGNADKMESSLSPDLAKRIARTNPSEPDSTGPYDRYGIGPSTRGGFGKQTPTAEQQKDVTIYDVFGGASTVKLEMRDWVDYMQIAKIVVSG